MAESMNPPIPENQAAAIVAVVEKSATGATMIDVAAALMPTPRERTVQRWLSILVQQKRLIRFGRTRGSRYKVPPSETVETPCSGPSKAAQAIHCLVTQPLAARTPADYRRVILERYRPNETYYLPADLRARKRPRGILRGAY